MENTAFRVVKKNFKTSGFDGEGARLNGGRWNSRGIPVVYTSDSLALCLLEIFVHLPSYELLDDYVYITVKFETGLVLDAPLPGGWDDRPVSKISQFIGDQWIKEGKSPVFKVPSVLMPDGFNYLINIHHPDFSRIRIGESHPLHFDPRLKK